MFSDVVKQALEREIVGQSRAVNSVVRGVTRVGSGLTPREWTLCAFLLMGPSGTGKTHMIRALARLFHGDESRLLAADCSHLSHADPSLVIGARLAPLYWTSPQYSPWDALEPPPLSIIRLEYLERAPVEVCNALASALETGHVVLPDGRRGSLRNCLIFLTSGLCGPEILNDPPRIGFVGSPLEEEEDDTGDRIHKVCLEKAEQAFGSDLMARIDGMLLFRGLEAEHLDKILDRRLERLNEWLGRRGFACEVLPAARRFLLERGLRGLRTGARDLVRAHQRHLEFPVADLLLSCRVPAGGLVQVDRRPDEEHLYFTVGRRTGGRRPAPSEEDAVLHRVPVA